jgi:hypothetical protein
MNGQIPEVLHENEGPDEHSGVMSRTAGNRVERKQNIYGKIDVQLPKLMQSRMELRSIQSFKLSITKMIFFIPKESTIFQGRRDMFEHFTHLPPFQEKRAKRAGHA